VNSVNNNTNLAALYTTTASATSQSATTGQSTNFMELLLIQMTHQNPLEPMKDSEMMGQMAQLNSVQELQTIKQAMQEMLAANRASYAASLVGKTAEAEVQGQTIKGLVTGVTIDGTQVNVHIGDATVPLDAVTEIGAEDSNG
jgi:flagellar basal-body rod modification protein FlgD